MFHPKTFLDISRCSKLYSEVYSTAHPFPCAMHSLSHTFNWRCPIHASLFPVRIVEGLTRHRVPRLIFVDPRTATSAQRDGNHLYACCSSAIVLPMHCWRCHLRSRRPRQASNHGCMLIKITISTTTRHTRMGHFDQIVGTCTAVFGVAAWTPTL